MSEPDDNNDEPVDNAVRVLIYWQRMRAVREGDLNLYRKTRKIEQDIAARDERARKKGKE